MVLYYLTFFNDFSCNSEILLFAYDLKILKVSNRTPMLRILQNKLYKTYEWCIVNYISLSISKCKYITLLKTRSIINYAYAIDNMPWKELMLLTILVFGLTLKWLLVLIKSEI